jgi:hypothetical protein
MLVNGSWTAPGGQTVPLNTGEVGHRHDPGDILDPLLQGSLLAFAKDQWPDTGTADATGGRMGSASTAGGGRLKAGTAGGGRPKVGTAGGGRSKSGTAAGAEGDVDDSEPDGLTGNQLANLIHATMGQDAQALLPSTAGGTLSASDMTRMEQVLAGAAQTPAQGKFAAFSNGDADWDSIFEQGIPAAIRLGSDDEIASGDYALHAVMVVGMTRDSVTFFDPQANGGRGGQGTMSRKAFQERAEWAIIPPANKYVRPVGGGGVPKGFAESRNALL